MNGKLKIFLNLLMAVFMALGATSARAEEATPEDKEKEAKFRELQKLVFQTALQGESLEEQVVAILDQKGNKIGLTGHHVYVVPSADGKSQMHIFVKADEDNIVFVSESKSGKKGVSVLLKYVSADGLALLKQQEGDEKKEMHAEVLAEMDAQMAALKIASDKIRSTAIPESSSVEEFGKSLQDIVTAALKDSDKGEKPEDRKSAFFKVVDGGLVLVKDGKELVFFKQYAAAAKDQKNYTIQTALDNASEKIEALKKELNIDDSEGGEGSDSSLHPEAKTSKPNTEEPKKVLSE